MALYRCTSGSGGGAPTKTLIAEITTHSGSLKYLSDNIFDNYDYLEVEMYDNNSYAQKYRHFYIFPDCWNANPSNPDTNNLTLGSNNFFKTVRLYYSSMYANPYIIKWSDTYQYNQGTNTYNSNLYITALYGYKY